MNLLRRRGKNRMTCVYPAPTGGMDATFAVRGNGLMPIVTVAKSRGKDAQTLTIEQGMLSLTITSHGQVTYQHVRLMELLAEAAEELRVEYERLRVDRRSPAPPEEEPPVTATATAGPAAPA